MTVLLSIWLLGNFINHLLSFLLILSYTKCENVGSFAFYWQMFMGDTG